ncbi:MAG TPA: FAD-dependent thymidylate synthase [Roseiflexaceae bacterium]|nr:FAD-dependent thymidylate synthase [Roseiflexaceae bacterium]HMP40353.1 FAD-dependent thymidylate synthase [Roseiflexaceae bacterium]
MSDLWDTPLDTAEQQRVQPYVTNVDQPIFGLRNLPEVVKGALFSRYSRSDKSLRRILLEEFIADDEAAFDGIVGAIGGDAAQISATRRAESFYDRVLIGYGDDSVAELGGAHIACEGVSNIAAKALEASRIGIAPLEKSTRYVSFGRKVNGRYRYYREPEIMASRHAAAYEQTLDGLFDSYTGLIEPLSDWVRQRSPRDAQTSERAYNSATRAKAFDLLRGLLPMATLTNLGLYGNGRAFEYLLTKAAASPHAEVRTIGRAMQHELDQIIPSFVKRARSERGAEYARYLAATRRAGAGVAQHMATTSAATSADGVELIDYDRNGETKVVAAILYPHTDLPLGEILAVVRAMAAEERAQLIRDYLGERGSRFHRPGRAFEEASYTFDLLADIGAYRDLQRHRMLTQQQQRYSVVHGYEVSPELVAAGLADRYRAALDAAAATYSAIAAEHPDAAQYIVPLAFRIRWRITLNLREAYHLIELRSARQGHPGYRRVAQQLYRHIRAVHPSLAAGMTFVDLNDYELERLAAEQRTDERLRRMGG